MLVLDIFEDLVFWHLVGNSHSSGPLSFQALLCCSTANVFVPLAPPPFSLSKFASAPSPGVPPAPLHPDPHLVESPKAS